MSADGRATAAGAGTGAGDVTTAAGVAALATTYWETWLELHPEEATVLGDHRYDDRLGDITDADHAASRTRYAAIQAQAASLDDAALTGEDRVTLHALRASVSADIADIDADIDAWNVDPLEGVPVALLNIPSYQHLATPDDGAPMAARWRAMAPYADAHTARLRASLADGRVACRAPTGRTLAILDELLATPDERWPMLEPLEALPDLPGWSTADRERTAEALRTAVAADIRPAFARLRDAIADEILPASRTADQPGLGHVEGGAAAYRALIRVHTSLDVSPEELHRIGTEEIARIDTETEALAGRVLGTRSRADALARLRGDPALHFTTRDEVAAKAQAALARANAATPAWFGRLPQAPCEVVPMPAHEEEHSTIAYYRQPASDGSRPGQYYINTYAPETRPRYEAEVLAYHEAVPGHHLQIAIGQELAHLPEFRKHLGPTAFFEGWGLYTERLADEMGLYSGDLDRIGVLSFDAWRASRLVVDTGMHALGWTRDQAIAYMTEHTALAPNNIVNEVDRYLSMPGQALAYKTGQLELLRLRTGARETLGPRFDIRAFHDTVLGSGALPLPVLRGVVARWIEARSGERPTPA